MSWLHAVREHIVALFGGVTNDRELEQEIAYHLELETRRHIEAGFDPATAQARALARFGDPRVVTDATRAERGTPLMEGGMQDLTWAVRSLRKSAGFTCLALATIALGIGATTAAYTVLDTVLLRPLPYRDADRLMLIREQTAKYDLRPPSYPNFADWRDRARGFDGIASAMFPYFTTVWPSAGAPEPLRMSIMGVSRRFFAILGVQPIVGREFTDDENRVGAPRVAMVSYEFWKASLGARQPLGAIRIGDASTPVVGVLPANFRFVTPADVYVPHEREPGTVRSGHNYLVVGRLRAGATLSAARADMTALSLSLLRVYGDETQAADADIRPLRDYLVADYRPMLTAVFGAAAMVLLIACVNLLSAQLARAWTREREVAVRAALGASRARLVRQLCLESAVLVTVGAALGLLLAVLLIVSIKTLGTGLLPRVAELAIDRRAVGFVVALTLFTTVIVGVYPAVRLSRDGSTALLRGARVAGTTVRAAMWRALVGFEVALAVTLLVGSALLIRTLHNILTADTGLDSRGIVTASLVPDERDIEHIDAIGTALRSVPGVSGVAFTSRLPFSWGNGAGPLRRQSDPMTRDWPAMAGFRVITPGYFGVLKQRVQSGREFTAEDRDGSPLVAIITQGAATKLWPGEDAVGKTIATNYLYKDWLTVVGVVSEATSWSMPRGEQHEIYVPLAQHPTRSEGQLIAVMRTAGDPNSLMPAIRARLRELVPGSPAQVGTIDERIARTAADRRFAMFALTAFGAIALVLAGIGIYGVVWYIVTTRTREIGIRMALGASASAVQRQLLGGALSMALSGVGAGLAGAVFATRFLQASLYGVSRLDPAVYSAGAAVTLLVALAGAYVPARRSSRVDPMMAIRAED